MQKNNQQRHKASRARKAQQHKTIKTTTKKLKKKLQYLLLFTNHV